MQPNSCAANFTDTLQDSIPKIIYKCLIVTGLCKNTILSISVFVQTKKIVIVYSIEKSLKG